MKRLNSIGLMQADAAYNALKIATDKIQEALQLLDDVPGSDTLCDNLSEAQSTIEEALSGPTLYDQSSEEPYDNPRTAA